MSILKRIIDLFGEVTKAAKTAGVSEVVGIGKDLTEVADNLTSAQVNRIEKKLKEAELEEKIRLIKIATDDDIDEYDPKVRTLRRTVAGGFVLKRRPGYGGYPRKGAAKKAAPRRVAVGKAVKKRVAFKRTASKKVAVKKSVAKKTTIKRTAKKSAKR